MLMGGRMGSWVRRLRGAFGLGLAWALAWFLAGMALLLVVGPDAADVPFPLGFGLLGFIGGVTFSAILGVVARQRRFDQMSLPGFALWGACGGLILSVGLVVAAPLGAAALVVLTPVFAIAGGLSAAGTLALARLGQDPPSIGSGGEVDRLEEGRR